LNSTGNRFERFLEHLALDRIVTRIRGSELHSDGLTWTRFGGSVALILVVLLFLSGAVMSFYYSPSPGAAYDSVDYASFSVPFGEIIRGVHHYAWNLLLVVMGLHLGRTFLVGAYKAPRQMVWISGVVILLIVPAFIFTGDLLPWDQKGYWSTKVRNSIMASIPLIGDFQVRVLQGSPIIGIITMTRYYVLHTIFLPGLLTFFIFVHYHFIKHRGFSDPLFKKEATRKKVPLFPDIINRWLALFLVTTVLLGLIAWQWPAFLGNPADPTDSSYVPKPEWWVLFLNQLVSIFTGPLTVVGTIIIPGGLLGLIIALPFIDRASERHPRYRGRIILIAAVIVIILLGLSIMGYVEHFVTPHA